MSSGPSGPPHLVSKPDRKGNGQSLTHGCLPHVATSQLTPLGGGVTRTHLPDSGGAVAVGPRCAQRARVKGRPWLGSRPNTGKNVSEARIAVTRIGPSGPTTLKAEFEKTVRSAVCMASPRARYWAYEYCQPVIPVDGLSWENHASWSGFVTGRSRSSTPSTMLKIAEVGADAQRHREHNDRGEARRPCERAQCTSQVPCPSVHCHRHLAFP